MTQKAVPDIDTMLSGWTDEAGGTTDLYSHMDDDTSESDYIKNSSGVADSGWFQLSLLGDPTGSINHTITFRMQSVGAGSPERCEIALWQSNFFQLALTGTKSSRGAWGTFSYTLTGAEADAITNYASLSFKVLMSNMGSGEEMRVAWVKFEVPDAAILTISVADCLQQKETLK